jgi:hypothetical protein
MYTGQKVMVWGFEDTASTAKVIVVANFRGIQHTITSVPWLAPGTWYNLADGSPFVVAAGSIDTMIVPAYTALVYSTIPDTILTGVEEGTGTDLPLQASLSPNYPNPFNPATTLRYSVPVGAGGDAGGMDVRLVVHDMLGHEVAVLAEGRQRPGTYAVTFNGAGRPSGVYLCTLTVGGVRTSRKMLLVK